MSRTTYASLFEAIGTTYGSGDGTSTFNLPDLRGRVVVAVGSNGHVATLGQNEGNADASRSPLHTHSVPAHSHGLGTLAVALAGNHNHSLPGRVDRQLATCTSQCLVNYPNIGPKLPRVDVHRASRLRGSRPCRGLSGSSPASFDGRPPVIRTGKTLAGICRSRRPPAGIPVRDVRGMDGSRWSVESR